MKKIIKNNIFGFVVGIILCSGIVYGVNTYDSNSIEYSPTDSSWEVNNVNEAINSLYNNVTELENIKSIGTATSAQILSGRTAVVQGSTITGTMTNRGAVTSVLNAGGSYTIPAGYHNGSGKVTANSLVSQTSGTAVAADIASGKTAWVNGTKLTGTSKGSTAPLNFKGNALYNTINITSGSMVCDGNILELQLPVEYTKLTINSSSNCEITLTAGLLVIKATGTGSAYVAGNGNRGGPSIRFSYDITVSAN